MICPTCGAELVPDANYCANCRAYVGPAAPVDNQAGARAHVNHAASVEQAQLPNEAPMSWIAGAALLVAMVADIFLMLHARGINILFVGAAAWLMWWIPLRRRTPALWPPGAPALVFAAMTVSMFFQASGAADRILYPLWLAALVYYAAACRNRLLGLEGQRLDRLSARWGGFSQATGAFLKGSASGEQKRSTGRQVILGLAVALPLCYVVLVLLSNADAMFELSVRNLMDAIAELPGHVFRIAALTVVLAVWGGLLLLARRRSGPMPGWEKPSFPLLSGAIVLASLAAVTGFFLCVHLQTVMLSPAEFMELVGQTYRSYLRRGFAELLTVEIIIGLTLLYILHTEQWREGAGLVHRAVSWCLIALTAGLAVSCAVRLVNYVDGYGLTLVRSLNFMGVALSFVCLGYLAVRVARPHSVYTSVSFIAKLFLVFFTIWSCLMPVQVIAWYNTQKLEYHPEHYIEYFQYLGPDTYPDMATWLEQNPDAVHPAVKYEIRQWAEEERKDLSKRAWFEWNPGLARARAALDRLVDILPDPAGKPAPNSVPHRGSQ